MPKKSRENQPPLLTERNLDRLGFFSVQSRLALDTTWESQFRIGGRSVHVHGEGTRGRPHGADTDLMLGVEQLFIAVGSPEDNWLHTTPNALRSAALMTKNGRAFHRMREGLLRIWSTGYIVREGWTAPDGSPVRFNAAFRLFEELRYWDKETTELPELLPNARLSIKLSEPLAASIRAGYTHALNRQVLTHLEQPHSRALYRLTEAHRYDELGTRRKELSVPLLDWREACGIRDERPSKVLRALSAAHEELEAAGYLSEVRISGRGQHQMLNYIFRQEWEPDPALVKLLVEQRISAPRAIQLATDYPDRIEPAIAYFRQQAQEGRPIRNPAGFIADIVSNPEKYVLPESRLPSHVQRQEAAQEQKRLQAERLREQQRVEAEQEQRLNEQLQLPPEEQWKAVEGMLRMMLGKRFSKEEMQTLGEACRSGRYAAAELAQKATKAAALLELEDFISTLREALRA